MKNRRLKSKIQSDKGYGVGYIQPLKTKAMLVKVDDGVTGYINNASDDQCDGSAVFLLIVKTKYCREQTSPEAYLDKEIEG